ncbi:MAG: S8 family peptidase, partial [Pseudohongiellaceae bacterium]
TGGGVNRDTHYPSLINADELHRQGITGDGVGVAIIDSGGWDQGSLKRNSKGENRLRAYYDATLNRTSVPMSDPNGHGTHIASVLASSRRSFSERGGPDGSFQGVAPDADLVIIKAFDEQGRGTYMDVIRGIAYAIAHKDVYNIKVMNLSFSGTPMSHYWQDPLNQAVMAAWEAGITVVASSGNSGPDPMTVGVPANVPYVISVGAMTDSYTPGDTTDDVLASFSAAGPTMEGFVKPEVIAPGGHMLGIMKLNTTIAKEYPQFHDGSLYFEMSGTSQAAAAASGAAALVHQAYPDLGPDDVKCKLLASAKAASNNDGTLAYSIFQQGAGLIDAGDAVSSIATGCANQGIDVRKDLAGT